MIGSQSAIESLPSDTSGISPDYHQQPTIGPGSGENVEPSFTCRAVDLWTCDTSGILAYYHQQPTIGAGSGENVEPSFAIHLWSWVKGFAGIEERIRRNQETDERIRG